MEYNKIVNPQTGRKCLVSSPIGRKVLKNYISRQRGGNTNCQFNEKTSRCSVRKDGQPNDPKCEYNSDSKRCKKVSAPKAAPVKATSPKASSPKASSPKAVVKKATAPKAVDEHNEIGSTELKNFDYKCDLYSSDWDKLKKYGYMRTDVNCARWQVSLSKSAHTRCRFCGISIPKGQTRVADTMYMTDKHDGGHLSGYYCMDCIFNKFAQQTTTHMELDKYGNNVDGNRSNACTDNVIESPIDYLVDNTNGNVPEADIRHINNLASTLRKHRTLKCKNYKRAGWMVLSDGRKIPYGYYHKPDDLSEPFLINKKVYLERFYNLKRYRVRDRDNNDYMPEWITADEKENKKEALKKGVCWDTKYRKYYVEPNRDLRPFMYWLPPNVLENRTIPPLVYTKK